MVVGMRGGLGLVLGGLLISVISLALQPTINSSANLAADNATNKSLPAVASIANLYPLIFALLGLVVMFAGVAAIIGFV